jgi:hypothetical protein
MTMDCEYCAKKKCECGGKRKVISRQVDDLGEVKMHCCDCGGEWFHWHEKRGSKIRGSARKPK